MLAIVFPLAIIAFMCFCFVKSQSVICKIVATIFLCLAAVNLFIQLKWVPGFMLEYIDYIMRLFTIGTLLFIFQLFKTASQVKMRGGEGANYNYIIGIALILMLVISFREEIGFWDGEWFYAYRVRVWPEIAVLTTVIIMKAKKVVLNKDEDNLLWFFAASCLYVLYYYFL